jgi:hypothetical protein
MNEFSDRSFRAALPDSPSKVQSMLPAYKIKVEKRKFFIRFGLSSL